MEIRINIQIEAKSDDVFAYISNFENNPKWQDGMISCAWITKPPLKVGSKYVQKAKFLGKDVDTVFEVIAYKEGEMVQAKSIQSSFPIIFKRSVRPLKNGTEVEAFITGDPSGFYKLAMPLMKLLVNKTIKKDYKNLKKILEQSSL